MCVPQSVWLGDGGHAVVGGGGYGGDRLEYALVWKFYMLDVNFEWIVVGPAAPCRPQNDES